MVETVFCKYYSGTRQVTILCWGQLLYAVLVTGISRRMGFFGAMWVTYEAFTFFQNLFHLYRVKVMKASLRFKVVSYPLIVIEA